MPTEPNSERIEWLLDMWTRYLPERAKKSYDQVGPFLFKVAEGKELTKEDRQLALDLLHDLAWLSWLPDGWTQIYEKMEAPS